MYERLSEHSATDEVALELLDGSKPGQGRPVLLLAAVHRMLSDQPEHPLASFYPSVSGEPVPPGDPAPAFASFLREHLPGLAELVATRATQTNEVNRSVAVAAGLRAAAADRPDTPIALVELGPSAGLNLRADTYAIEFDDGVRHQAPDSPVVLTCRPAAGSAPPDVDTPLPSVVARVGLDLNPIDVRADEDDVRWLEACLWPEQIQRLQRFRAAVASARAEPPRLVQGDLLDDLPAVLDDLPAGAHAFVFHSWVLTYVARERRGGLDGVIAEASRSRPISWFSAEASGVVSSLDAPVAENGGLTVLGLVTAHAGDLQRRFVGTCHPHLAWIDWQP